MRPRASISSGAFGIGDFLSSQKYLAAEYDVALSAVHRAFELLREWKLVDGPASQRPVVTRVPEACESVEGPRPAHSVEPRDESTAVEFELRHLGQAVRRFRMSVDHTDNTVLDKILRTAVRRSGNEQPLDEFELVILQTGAAE